jgi:flagellar protein FlgJ
LKKMEKMPIDQTDSAAPVPAGKRGERKIDREKLRKACGDFEALLVDRMLKSMRQTIPRTGFLGNDPGKEIYQGLMDQELSRKISQRGVLHLGDMIYRQVIKGSERPRTDGQPGSGPSGQNSSGGINTP